MRFVTYGGLVVRRVWAKRGTLAGSFAGAAIVIALFVVVPSYEDSIKAIDLQFAISGTGSDETAVEMNASMTDFVLSDVVRNRTVVDTNGAAFLLPWYTKSFEWVRSREFVVIPPSSTTDWEADADTWRQRKDEFVDANPGEEFEEKIVYPRPPREPLQFRTWSGIDVESRLNITKGSWPDPIVQQTKGESVPVLGVVLGADVARLANLERAQIGRSLVRLVCPFDEFDGEDEGDGESELGESVDDAPVGVSAELPVVGEPRVGALNGPPHREGRRFRFRSSTSVAFTRTDQVLNAGVSNGDPCQLVVVASVEVQCFDIFDEAPGGNSVEGGSE